MNKKSFIKDSAEKERSTHYISNIMMTAVLGLIIVLTLCFGVKVNIGSAYFDDNEDVFVNQSIFKLVDVTVNSSMTKEEAEIYVEKTNKVLLDEYGVLGFEVKIASTGENPGFDELGDFSQLVADLGDNASKVNLLKYKLAYAIAIADATSDEHKMAYDNHRIFAMSGQVIIITVTQFAVLIIALIMLVFAVLSLIKKRENGKMRFAFILLSLCALFNIMMFSGFSFISMNIAGILAIAVTAIGVAMLSLIRHMLMEKRDFSRTMLIHNAVLLVGVLIALALYLSPIFKMTNDIGTSTNIGWAYMFDYRLTVMAAMSAVMAYTLSYIISILLFLLPAVLLIAISLVVMARFMAADYQLNDKRVLLFMAIIINLIEFALFAAFSANGELGLTDLYIKVKLNILPMILGILVIGGLIAFEILYRVKPIKKELIIR